MAVGDVEVDQEAGNHQLVDRRPGVCGEKESGVLAEVKFGGVRRGIGAPESTRTTEHGPEIPLR
jgi:hypothetical protein